MSIDNKLITVAENEQAITEEAQRVFEAGKAQRDYEWWDYYQNDFHGTSYEGTSRNCIYMFAGSAWRDAVYNPIKPLEPTGNSQMMYAYSNITDTKVPITLASGKSVGNVGSTFKDSKLVTIREVIVDEYNSMDNQFQNATKLQNLKITGVIGKTANFKWCPLTRASIESVVSCLSDTTSGLTCTFKATAVENAFTTEEWEALTATKPNWTFAVA